MLNKSTIRTNVALLTSFIAVLVGVFAKLSLTRGELLPGIDGAYYWVQVRSILTNQSLAFPDLPLVFWVQAALAKIIGDVQLGVRISDAFLPALSAIPIFLIAKRYNNRFLPAMAILVVLLHPIQLYFFTGDFIKNESVIPAVFFIALVLLNWDLRSKKFSIISLLILLLIVSLSHFGTALFAVVFVGLWALLQMRNRGLKYWISGIALMAAALMAILVTFALLVPTRFDRVMNFLSNPSSAFKYSFLDEVFNGFAEPVIPFTIITTQLAVIIFAVISWFIRNRFTFSEKSVVVSSLVTAFAFSSPFISRMWVDRLTALSFVPLAIAAIIIFGKANFKLQKAPVVIVAGVVLLASTLWSSNLSRATFFEWKVLFSNAKYAEFKALAQQTELPPNSIIVARWGVHYLCAWHFETDVVLMNSFFYDSATVDLSSYSAVFLLDEIGTNKKDDWNLDLKKKDEGAKAPALSSDKTSQKGDKKIAPTEIGGEMFAGNDSFTLTRIR